MKTKLAWCLALFILILPRLGTAELCTDPTHLIQLGMPLQAKRAQAIQKALSNDPVDGYCKYTSIDEGKEYCEVCFAPNTQLQIYDLSSIKGIQLQVPPSESRPIYVSGLTIKRIPPTSDQSALFSVLNNSTTSQVTLDNIVLSQVKNGLALGGVGPITVSSTTVTGQTKDGTCIDVNTPGAMLKTVTTQTCATGIQIGSSIPGAPRIDNVHISDNSVIKENLIGVRIRGGAIGTAIVDSSIHDNYDNDFSNLPLEDGIRFDSPPPVAIQFYKWVSGVLEPIPLGNTGIVLDSKERIVRMSFIVPPGESIDGLLEVFSSDSFGQPYKPVDFLPSPIQVSSAILTNGILSFAIPFKESTAHFTAIYTHSKLGTSGISRSFAAGDEGSIVSFVTSPYEIPTPTGGAGSTPSTQTDDNSDDMNESDNTSTQNTMNDTGAMAEGVDDSTFSMTSTKCSLIASGQIDYAGIDLITFLTTLSLLAVQRWKTLRLECTGEK